MTQRNDETVVVAGKKGNSKMERLKQLAQEPNARVIMCNVPDTFPLTDLIRSADQAIKRLRNSFMRNLPASTVVPLMDKYNKAVCDLEEAVRQIAEAVNMDFYRMPRGVKRMREQLGMEEVPEKKG